MRLGESSSLAILTLTTLLVFCFGSRHKYNQLIDDMVLAIEHGMAYYHHNYQAMNIDGIFGLKIVEGQTGLILSMKDRSGIGRGVYSRIQRLHALSANISRRAVPYLKQRDQQYYQTAGKMLIPWKIWMPARSLNNKLLWNSLDSKFSMNESDSDKCLSELLIEPKSCNISTFCADLMLRKRGTKSYSITHQVIYTHLLHMVDCTDSVNTMMTNLSSSTWSVHLWQNELCANIMSSMTEKLMMEGEIRDSYQDLFMEEIFVCGVVGFAEFMKPLSARKIVTWQLGTGCFGETSQKSSRRLMEERELTDGCMAHTTAVGVSALIVLLHSFLDTSLPPSQDPPSLVHSYPGGGDTLVQRTYVKLGHFRHNRLGYDADLGLHWTFALFTVLLTLVLLWRARVCRICRRPKVMSL